MNRGLLIIALLLVPAVIVGCSSADSSSRETGLLQLADMPAGTVSRKSLDPNKPCSPLPVLSTGIGAVKRTPSFKSGHLFAQESVAFFPDESAAEETYTALTSKERSECIASTARFAGRVLQKRTSRGEFGDGEHALVLELEKPRRDVEIRASTVRQGSVVGVLLLVADPAPLPREEVERILTVAADRMSEAKAP